jgi:hypothetical protein
LEGCFLTLMLDLVFRDQYVECDLDIYLDELSTTTTNPDTMEEAGRSNTIDLQSSSDDTYDFSAEQSSTGGRMDVLNYVSDNHP